MKLVCNNFGGYGRRSDSASYVEENVTRTTVDQVWNNVRTPVSEIIDHIWELAGANR